MSRSVRRMSGLFPERPATPTGRRRGPRRSRRRRPRVRPRCRRCARGPRARPHGGAPRSAPAAGTMRNGARPGSVTLMSISAQAGTRSPVSRSTSSEVRAVLERGPDVGLWWQGRTRRIDIGIDGLGDRGRGEAIVAVPLGGVDRRARRRWRASRRPAGRHAVRWSVVGSGAGRRRSATAAGSGQRRSDRTAPLHGLSRGSSWPRLRRRPPRDRPRARRCRRPRTRSTQPGHRWPRAAPAGSLCPCPGSCDAPDASRPGHYPTSGDLDRSCRRRIPRPWLRCRPWWGWWPSSTPPIRVRFGSGARRRSHRPRTPLPPSPAWRSRDAVR